MDLSNLSSQEIAALLAQLPKELDRRKKENRSVAIAAIKATAQEYGFTLADLFGDVPASAPVKNKRAAVADKYRDPENPENTWTGRGIKPRWLQAKLAAGASIESFLIA